MRPSTLIAHRAALARIVHIAVYAGLAWAGSLSAQTPDIRYHIVKRLELDSGAADYFAVDVSRRRLYGFDYKVVDVDGDSIVGEVPNHAGHGFALASDLGVGIGRRGILFDLNSGDRLGQLALAGDGSVYDPTTHRAFLLADTVSVVDMRTRALAGRFALGEGGTEWAPEGAVSDSAGRIFINVNFFPDTSGNTKPFMVIVDPATLTVLERRPLDPCQSPNGLAIDRRSSRLFVGCRHMVLVLDAKDGRQVATIPVVGHPDVLAFDPAWHLIFSPSGLGTMAVIHQDDPDHYRVVQIATTAEGGNAAVVDERTHNVFLFKHYKKALRLVILAP